MSCDVARKIAGCLIGAAFAIGAAAPAIADTVFLGSSTRIHMYDTTTGTTATVTGQGNTNGWAAPRPLRLVENDRGMLCTSDSAGVACYGAATNTFPFMSYSVATGLAGPYNWDVSQDSQALLIAAWVLDPATGANVRGMQFIDPLTRQVRGQLSLETYAIAFAPNSRFAALLTLDKTDTAAIAQGLLPLNLTTVDNFTRSVVSTVPIRDQAGTRINGPWPLYGMVNTGNDVILWNADPTASVLVVSDAGIVKRRIAVPGVNALTVSANNRTAYVATGAKAQRIDLDTGTVVADYADNLATGAALSTDEATLYVVGGQGGLPGVNLGFWNAATNTITTRQGLADAEIRSVAARPKLRRMAPPNSGWWWDPTRSGMGFSVEVQGDDRAYIGTFTYEPGGLPVWYVTTCTLQPNGFCAGPLHKWTGGTTLNGTFQPPVYGGSAGGVTFAFWQGSRGLLATGNFNADIVRFPIDQSAGITAPPAWAPQSGWWWAANEPGIGWFIESQGTIDQNGTVGSNMFLVGHMYRPDGSPVWYSSNALYGELATAGGPTPFYQGALTEFANGPVVGQPGTGATTVVGTRGTVSLQFTSATTATLVMPDGRTVPLTRYVIQ